MSTQWKSSYDRVVIKKDEVKRETAGGIVLPEKGFSTVSTGVVLAAGPNAHGVLPGDNVFYFTKQATSVGEDVVSVSVDGVLAIQREE